MINVLIHLLWSQKIHLLSTKICLWGGGDVLGGTGASAGSLVLTTVGCTAETEGQTHVNPLIISRDVRYYRSPNDVCPKDLGIIYRISAKS